MRECEAFAVVTLSCLKMLTVAGWRIVGVNGDPVNDLAHLKQLLFTTTASAEGCVVTNLLCVRARPTK
eukprot:COSAG01_NODE_499_length_16240_cov_43.337092_4_plen_68_part_00